MDSSFETTVPHSGNISTLKGYIELEYFDLKQTAHLIKLRADMERDYWKAVIKNDQVRIMELHELIGRTDARIQRWATTKSDKVR